MADRINSDWNAEDTYWRDNYRTRPYAATGGRDYSYYQPGYRYGYESAQRYSGRKWEDVESDLSRDWNNVEYRGESTWDSVKHAVRDAWDRVMGRHPVSSR